MEQISENINSQTLIITPEMLTKVPTSAARTADETMEQYRARRKKMQEDLVEQLAPTLLWDSSNRGTYQRSKHGELKSRR